MLRRVRLPDGVAGGLWLSAMPGHSAPLQRTWDAVDRQRIGSIVCLAEPGEIRVAAPTYAAALEAGATPCPVEAFPVADSGVPGDREAFRALAARVGQRLAHGGRVLVHCRAGVGRTGTLAVCVLLALGEPLARARETVASAGSHPETAAQQALVAWCAAREAAQ